MYVRRQRRSVGLCLRCRGEPVAPPGSCRDSSDTPGELVDSVTWCVCVSVGGNAFFGKVNVSAKFLRFQVSILGI